MVIFSRDSFERQQELFSGKDAGFNAQHVRVSDQDMLDVVPGYRCRRGTACMQIACQHSVGRLIRIGKPEKKWYAEVIRDEEQVQMRQCISLSQARRDIG